MLAIEAGPWQITILHNIGFVGFIPNSDLSFRLDVPGDYRTVSFLGHESFTVHIGVCPLDLSTSAQKAQLWATVRFDVEVNTILEELISKAGPSKGADLSEQERDVNPDESMLVQSWKDARCTFGSKGRQVRLTFSYPHASADGKPDPSLENMAEVYELDIRFSGHYRPQGGGSVKRKSTISTSSAATTSRPGGREVATRRRTLTLI